MAYTFAILWFIVAHWVADFVLQTHWQASNKSKNWNALARHVCTYTVAMTASACMYLREPGQLAAFAIVTFVAHFATDAVTSRWTSRLWAKQDWHNFFVVVGFDQVLHYAQIFVTVPWILYGYRFAD